MITMMKENADKGMEGGTQRRGSAALLRPHEKMMTSGRRREDGHYLTLRLEKEPRDPRK